MGAEFPPPFFWAVVVEPRDGGMLGSSPSEFNELGGGAKTRFDSETVHISDEQQNRNKFMNDSSNPLKAINDAYRSGYGQAKADVLDHVNQAMSYCNWALEEFEKYIPNSEELRFRHEMKIRISELQRVRAVLKAIKPKVATHE